MKTLKKIFGGIRMTWLKVIVISIVTGVCVGALMVPAALKDTSFQDPGITLEFWVMFALFIVLNCEKPLEAGAKTFVAFLISQPIIYLVQVPFSALGFGLFGYYPYWFMLTLLTFPGGMIAWLVKKGNWLSVAILSVANVLLCVMLAGGIVNIFSNFPHHLLALIFIAAEIVFFILLLFKGKKRIVAFILAFVFLLAGFAYEYVISSSGTKYMVFAEGEAPYTLKDKSEMLNVTFDGSIIDINYKTEDLSEEDSFYVIYTDGSGEEHRIDFEYRDGQIYQK